MSTCQLWLMSDIAQYWTRDERLTILTVEQSSSLEACQGATWLFGHVALAISAPHSARCDADVEPRT